RLGEAHARLGLGELADRLEQPQEARAHYQAALDLYQRLGDRYSIARAILLSYAPFLLRRGPIREAFQAYAAGLRATLSLEDGFFLAFLEGALQQVRALVRAQPEQAAEGCALLLQELGSDLEEARSKGDARAASLLTIALTSFQICGRIALARMESGDKRRATFQRARELAEQVDQATHAVFELVAWVDEMAAAP
ncbi:MAG: hypothetical protein ACUVSF_13505, partial [Anaerolineae bacterium]